MDRDRLLGKVREVNQAVRTILLIEEGPPDAQPPIMQAAQKLNLSTRKGEATHITMNQNQTLQVINTRVVNVLGLLDELQDVVLAGNDATGLRPGQVADNLRAGLVIAAGLALDGFMTWTQAQAALKVAVVDEAIRRYPSQARAAQALGLHPANLTVYLRQASHKQLAPPAGKED